MYTVSQIRNSVLDFGKHKLEEWLNRTTVGECGTEKSITGNEYIRFYIYLLLQ